MQTSPIRASPRGKVYAKIADLPRYRHRIIAAIKEVDIKVPVVVRLEGNNADIGAKILSKANIKIESINNLSDAAKKAVELAK